MQGLILVLTQSGRDFGPVKVRFSRNLAKELLVLALTVVRWNKPPPHSLSWQSPPVARNVLVVNRQF